MAEIRIHGLRELGQAFKQVDREYGKQLQRGLKGIMETVAGAIRSKAPGGAGAYVKARATQRGGSIVFPGGEGTDPGDQFPWLDFGGSTGKGHQVGMPWSGSVERERISGGRYVYPAIAENRGEIQDRAGDLLLDTAKDAGFVTHG